MLLLAGWAIAGGCGGGGTVGQGRAWTGPVGKTTTYFVGVWQGRSPAYPSGHVIFRVRLIGESITDRSRVAVFEERWYRGQRALRWRRAGTMRFLDGALVMQIRANTCAARWDNLERPVVESAAGGAVTLRLMMGTVRYRWLRGP